MGSTESASLFGSLEQIDYDEPYRMGKAFLADPSPDKVSLGIGVYRDGEGKPWTLPSVKQALAQLPDLHDYIPGDGFPPFVRAARELVFGPATEELAPRIVSIQTIAGTGACHVGAELLVRLQRKPKTVWIADPTWLNHGLMWKMAADDVQQKPYPYYNAATKAFDLEGTLAALRTAERGDVIILQTCSQNPTGIDPTPAQWTALADVCEERGIFPFFDNAYQGFATGDPDADAWAIRHFASRPGMELCVAQSFSKNMGLYGERIGAFHLLVADPALVPNATTHVVRVLRGSVSSCASAPARAVASVLSDPALRAQWHKDIQTMGNRIKSMREQLRAELEALGTPGTWNHITDQIGMFSYTGLTKGQVAAMATKHHIYMLSSGRISLPGLNESNVKRVAAAFDDVVRNVE